MGFHDLQVPNRTELPISHRSKMLAVADIADFMAV